MKIAYLSTFYPFKGGIAKFNSTLTNELINQGHDVKTFTFTTQYPSFLVKDQLAKQRYESDVEGQRVLSTINPFSWLKTINEIKKFEPDLLLMKYWVTELAPSLGFVYRHIKKHTKIITILDNVKPHEHKFYDKYFNKYFLKKQTAFVAMSEEVKKDLLLINKNAKVVLISHPIYNYGEKLNKNIALEKLNLKQNKKTILFFGLIRDYKGLDLLINAFSELDDTYQLIIAGECRNKVDFYENLIADSKNKNITFINKFISDNDVNLYFSAADVCILPYRSATQSGITGICYHFELPMIATNVGGLAEMIEDNKTGIIAEKADKKSLQNAINVYFKQADIEYFNKNIKTIKDFYSWENFAKKLLETVKE